MLRGLLFFFAFVRGAQISEAKVLYQFDADVTGTFVDLGKFEVYDVVTSERQWGATPQDYTLEDFGLETASWFRYATGDSWSVRVTLEDTGKPFPEASCVINATGFDLCVGYGSTFKNARDGFRARGAANGSTMAPYGDLRVSGNNGTLTVDDDTLRSGLLPGGQFYWTAHSGLFEYELDIKRWIIRDEQAITVMPLPAGFFLLIGALGLLKSLARRGRQAADVRLAGGVVSNSVKSSA